jgi:hypothetical protein
MKKWYTKWGNSVENGGSRVQPASTKTPAENQDEMQQQDLRQQGLPPKQLMSPTVATDGFWAAPK